MTDKAPSKLIIRAAARYKARLEKVFRILRDASGKMQWADGKSVGQATVAYMLSVGMIHQLDTDLFGDPDKGQTLGL